MWVKIWSFEKVDLWWVEMRQLNFLKFKVVRNRAKFWKVFVLSNCMGGLDRKICTKIVVPVLKHAKWKSFVRLLPLARKLSRLIR